MLSTRSASTARVAALLPTTRTIPRLARPQIEGDVEDQAQRGPDQQAADMGPPVDVAQAPDAADEAQSQVGHDQDDHRGHGLAVRVGPGRRRRP